MANRAILSIMDFQKSWKPFVALHMAFGLFFSTNKFFPTLWCLFVVAWGVAAILRSRNRDGVAHFLSAYVVGLEIFIRMTGSYLFHEFSKYAICLFLGLALIVEARKIRNHAFILAFGLLLPAITATDAIKIGIDWRQIISSNLSGPLCLCVAATYFYNRKVSAEALVGMIYVAVVPLFAAVSHILRYISSLESLGFGTESNKGASGGFGPNQVSSALGMGAFLALLPLILGRSLSGKKWLDWVVAGGFFVFSLLTFSRGGVLTAIVATLAATLTAQAGKRSSAGRGRIILNAILMVVVVVGAWRAVDYYSKGMLEKRWTKELRSGKEVTFTNRRTLAQIDYMIFLDNRWVGAGVGMTRPLHARYGIDQNLEFSSEAAAHTEFTRLLAEHGLLGLLALCILLFFAGKRLLSFRDPMNASVAYGFMCLALITMAHSATRLSLTGFFFGAALLKIQRDGEHTTAIPAKRRAHLAVGAYLRPSPQAPSGLIH